MDEACIRFLDAVDLPAPMIATILLLGALRLFNFSGHCVANCVGAGKG